MPPGTRPLVFDLIRKWYCDNPVRGGLYLFVQVHSNKGLSSRLNHLELPPDEKMSLAHNFVSDNFEANAMTNDSVEPQKCVAHF